MARKSESIFGKYDSNVKIGLFFSLLALFLIIPFTIDFSSLNQDLIWVGFVSGPVIFSVFSGLLIAKKNKTPSKSDILVTALAFSIIYIAGLFISPFDTIYIGGNNWLGTIFIVYFFSIVGVLIGKYGYSLFQ